MRSIQHIQTGSRKLKKKTLSILAVMVAAIGLSGAAVLPALADGYGSSQATVYSNLVSPTPSNVPSVGYEATSTSELGSQVSLDGSARKNPKVTVLMSSWACKSGSWNGLNCITNAGSTFTHPVTLKVYNVEDDDAVGSVIATDTETFTMPYRPTADDGTNCSGANAGKWWDGSACVNGKAFKISFNLNNVTLPDDVIIGVSYNTTHHGYAPIGTQACNSTPQGCPYDSLNVGTSGAPTVGESEPDNFSAYYATTYGPNYCDGGADPSKVGVFRLDQGCWTEFNNPTVPVIPALKVEASPGKGKSNHHPKHGKYNQGHKKYHNYNGYHGFYGLGNR